MRSDLSVAHLPNRLIVHLDLLPRLVCVKELLTRRNALFVLLSARSGHWWLLLELSSM